MANTLAHARQRFFDAQGVPLAFGKVWTYDAGTTVPRPTFADAGEVTANTNPVVLDANGEATIYWRGTYKVNLTTSADVQVPGWPEDNVSDDGAATMGLAADLASTASGKGTSLVGVYDAAANFSGADTESVLAEIAARIGQLAIMVTEPRFGAVADSNGTAGNGTDNTAALTAAVSYAVTNRCTLVIPSGNGLFYRHTGPLPVLVEPLSGGFGRGCIITGTGPGSVIFNDSMGDSFVLDATSGAADMGTQIRMHNLRFHSNTGTRPTSFIRNKKGINTHISGMHFMSVFLAAGGGCCINEVAYGLRYEKNIHRGVVGDALVLRSQPIEANGYSFVVTVEGCDFSFCTRGIYCEGTNILRVVGNIFGENTDSGLVVDPTVNLTQGFNILIDGNWFEKNTNFDIDLRSTVSNWCEATARSNQFGGVSPTFKGHINLGAKSRIVCFGTPTGNTVDVTGSSTAGFYGIGTKAKFIKVGTFYWNEYDFAGGIDTPALAVDVSSGDVIANLGAFLTQRGATTIPTGVATTMFTMPSSTNAVYMLTTTAGTSGPAAWTVVAIVACSASLATLTVLKTSSNLTLSLSGLNVQGTQSTGSSVTVGWTVTRLQ